MKLSVITINLNNADGLRKTIESVITQIWKEFEFIVIDGGSTDGSLEIIKETNSHFFSGSTTNHFTWISEIDSGVYQAMNKGINMAKGDYLLFLNSGDFLVDNKVLEIVFSKNRTADILCGKCDVSENGKVIWTTNPPEFVTFGTLYNEGLAHQSTFIKRSLLKSIGLYREDFKYNSDVDFWFRSIIINDASTVKVDLVISNYNLDGISSKEHKTEAFKKEINEIYSQANFKKFIPDYDSWNLERKNMEVLYWVESKFFFYKTILIVFNLLRFVQKFKKKDGNNQ